MSGVAPPSIAVQLQRQNAQRSDLCHVYVLDPEQAQRLMQELLSMRDPTEAQALALKKKYPAAEQILGEFEAIVGEEELTTKSYQVPGTRQYVTASVYYTDEMMRSDGHSDSMNLAIVISSQRHENAMLVDNNSTSQVSYNSHTDKIQVKSRIRIDGRLKLIGLECQARVKTLHPTPR
jgi:hypothetical protein